MTVASLFSGAGGADLGFIAAGFEPIWFAEIDSCASSVLAYHHPNVPNYGDVTKIDENQLTAPDVLWMSPPCQDLSVAGKRAGLEGSRSSLFYDAIRIAKHLVRNGTRFVCMEQVPGLFSADNGEAFRRVLLEFLELRPIDLGWRVLDSQYAHVAQRRERAFFVLDFGGRSVEQILSLAEGMSGYPAPRREAGTSVANAITTRAGSRREPTSDTFIPEVSATLGTHEGGANEPAGFGALIPFDTTQITSRHNRSRPKDGDPCHPVQSSAHPPAIAFTVREDATAPNGGNFHAKETDVSLAINAMQPGEQSHHAQLFIATVRRITPREGERLQGWPDDYTRWGIKSGVKVEISDAQRFRMIGNGVTATIAGTIARKIRRIEDGR